MHQGRGSGRVQLVFLSRGRHSSPISVQNLYHWLRFETNQFIGQSNHSGGRCNDE